jgi:hypothetical protein
VAQAPARDAAAGAVALAVAIAASPLVAEVVQATLPPGAVTTGTYRRRKKP